MKIRIKDKYTLTTLENLKGLYLLDDRGNILIIHDYEYEVITETPPEKKAKSGYFIRKKDKVNLEPKKKYYLTKLEVHGYNPELKFIGLYNEDWCGRMIWMQENDSANFSFTKLRKKFVRLEEQMKAFGFKLEHPVKEEEDTPVKEPEKKS